MKRLFYMVSVVFLTLCAQTVNGQISYTGDSAGFLDKNLLEIGATDWSIYADDENGLIYVDFENIGVNLNDLLVRNKNGEIVFKDEVWNLPVDTIYEIDLTAFGNGTFEVELRYRLSAGRAGWRG